MGNEQDGMLSTAGNHLNLGAGLLSFVLLTLLESYLLGPRLVLGDVGEVIILIDNFLLRTAMAETSVLTKAPRIGRSVLADSEAREASTRKALDHRIGFVLPIEIDRNWAIFLGVLVRVVLMPKLPAISATESVQIRPTKIGY